MLQVASYFGIACDGQPIGGHEEADPTLRAVTPPHARDGQPHNPLLPTYHAARNHFENHLAGTNCWYAEPGSTVSGVCSALDSSSRRVCTCKIRPKERGFKAKHDNDIWSPYPP